MMRFSMSREDVTPVIEHLAAPIRRIAVFRALYLGDLLCAVPALRALRRRFPAAEITLIGLPWAEDLVRRLPYIDRFLAFPGYPGIHEVEYRAERTQAFLAETRAAPYDLALQMHGDGTAGNGFVSALAARVSLGYRRKGDHRLTLGLPYRRVEHEVLRWLRLVALTGAAADDTRMEFPATAVEAEQAATLLCAAPDLPGPRVGLHAGSKDLARRWPLDRFARLADTLVEQFGARLILTGNSNERGITAAIRWGMRHPALNLAGKTDLGTFAAIIGQLDLLVTNDTGASHLAAATGTPSVVLFGPSRPEQWAPLDRKRHRVIDALALGSVDTDPRDALWHLPVDPVFRTCTAVLSARGSRQPVTHPTLQEIEVGGCHASLSIGHLS